MEILPYKEIIGSLPVSNTPDYFLKPCMNELVEREIEHPDYCSRVPDFTISRIAYSFIKFLGNTDVRRLDLDQIVKFQRHEVIVYSDESSNPVVGEELNKAAEVNLIVNIPNLTWGKEQVDQIAYKLKQSTERQGTTFILLDPENGLWKFLVPHFSRFGLSDEEAEDIAMDDASGSGDPVGLDGDKVADIDEEHQMETSEIELSHSLPAHLGLDPGKMKEMRMLMFLNEDLDENEDFRDQTSHHMTSLTKRNVRSSQKISQRNSYQDTPPVVRKSLLALLEYNPGNDKSSLGPTVRNSKMGSFELDISHVTTLTDNYSCNAVDAALFMGRSFQAGWGPNGILFHTGKPICSSSSQIVLSFLNNNEKIAIGKVVWDRKEKVQKELFDSAFDAPLSLHKELDHQEEEVRFGSFSLKLQRVVTDRVVLSDICRSYIGIIEKQLEVTGLSTSAKLFLMHQVMAWELIKVIFSERHSTESLNYAASDNELDMMHDVKDDSAEVNTEALLLIRRAKCTCWLQKSVSHCVQEDVSDLNGSGYLEHLFFLLTGRELNSAVELATCKGDVRLACFLSQAGGSTVNRNDILQQLHLWRRNRLDFNYIEKKRIKLYELLAGNIHDALLDSTIDWMRFLGLLMWHHVPPDSSLPRIFRYYQLLLDQVKALWPVPIYIHEGPTDGVVSNSKHSDLLYYLMLLIVNIPNLTWGKEQVDQIAYKLKQSTERQGATFISFDPDNGLWKFLVPYFSRYGLSDDVAEDIAMHDAPALGDFVGLDGDKVADIDEEHQMETSEPDLFIQPFPEISRMSRNLDSQKKRRICLDGSSALCEHSKEISDSLPTLNSPDYFLKPCMNELVEREIENPGYCSRVPEFTIGRIGYGSIKFLGNTDVRRLDLDQIVKFRRHEVIVYKDESSKPVVGEGLNKAAEVTLMVNIPNLTWGKKQVDQIAYKVKQSTERQGATFISFDPNNGLWEFLVPHFSKYGLSDDEAEDIAMHDAPALVDPVGLDGDKVADIDEEHQMETSEPDLSIQPFSEISRMSRNLDSQKKRRICLDGSSALCEHSKEISDSLPTLNAPDYFLKPCMNELVEREIDNPGYCSRVPEFTIGRIGYGSIKFLGNTDVRRLDLDQIVKFRRHEVIVYKDESSKPVVGEGLNKAAEVTLMVNIPNLTWWKEQADQIAYKLKQSTERQGATFISFDPDNGLWKFLVPHFSRFGLSDDEAEDSDEIDVYREQVSHLVPFLTQRNVRPSQKSSGGKPGRKKQQRLTFEGRKLQSTAGEGSLKPGKPKTQKTSSLHLFEIEKKEQSPTNVWWDYENAAIPFDLPAKELYGRFLKKLREEEFTGPVKIRIIAGYKDSIPQKVLTGLYEGVSKGLMKKFKLKYAKKVNRPTNSKNDQVADVKLKSDIDKWLAKGPKPQNVMLVTGDGDFKDALKKLRNAGHRLMLASRDIKSQDVTSGMKIEKDVEFKWNWRQFLSLPLNSTNKKTRDAEFRKRMADKAAQEANFEKMREAVETKKKKRPDLIGRLPNLVPHITQVNSDVPHDATLDRQRLHQRVTACGLREVEVSGDGNCQFLAISDQLYGCPSHHEEVRRQIVTQLDENPQWYQGFVLNNYNQYCKDMAKLQEWGDHVTLQAAADRFAVRICLVTSFQHTAFTEIVPRDGEIRSELWLSYWSQMHYNSLYDNQAPPDQPKLKKRKRGF